ncbi:MAG: TrmH family RNA methyltransferase [Planctomycetota bacterium]
MNSPLENVSVVLVEPRGPRNVGSTARAMKNFGVRDLRIVGEFDREHPECREMSVGAHDLLEAARDFATLADALADVGYVLGSTARPRRRRPSLRADDAARRVVRAAATERVALVFGREDYGLYKDELGRCHDVVTIETSPDHASLNLSQAVLLLCHEVFRCTPEREAVRESRDLGSLASQDVLERLHGEFVHLAEASGYLHPGNRRAMIPSFGRFLRAGPVQTRDARHVFGLVRRLAQRLEEGGRP